MQPEQWKALDRRHLIHPFTRVPVEQDGGPIVIRRARGCTLEDVDGNTYLDGIGGLWLAAIGYGREELARAAADQMKQVCYTPIFWGLSHEPAIRLAARLADLTPGDLNRVFFTSGGSEANETSIKMARAYHRLRGEPDRQIIIAFRRAYHGVSIGAMTATGLDSVRTGFGPLAEGFVHIDPPYAFRCPHGEGCTDCGAATLGQLEETIRRIGPERVAAFIGEPVLGVGGVIVPPAGFYQGVREICDRYGVLWIADEVITGFGRTGRWFGVEHWGVTPDIMSVAKGITSGYMPLGASILGDHIHQALEEAQAYVSHGFTYSGHPVACAVALENLRIIESEDLVGRAERMGAELRAYLEEKDNPFIGEIRGKGLMCAVELVQDRERRDLPAVEDAAFRIQARCRQQGVLVRGVSPGNIVTMSPPLVIELDQVRRLVDTLDAAIREVVGGEAV